ncbi:MAG: hypothetical protein JO035_11285 [Betaproteobacteria bacterium]|nr:hypothetical protein [Betaproteobacteria bacterium]
MLPARIASIVALIPGRVARMPSGTPFSLNAASRSGAHLLHLAPFLGWTSPLNALSREDQQALGLTAAHGKGPGEDGLPGAADEDDDEPEVGRPSF